MRLLNRVTGTLFVIFCRLLRLNSRGKIIYFLAVIAPFSLNAQESNQTINSPEATETQYLNDYAQLLKQEVIDLGLKLAQLAWVGSLPDEISKTHNKNNIIDKNLLSMGQTLARLEDGLLTPPGRQLVIFISTDLPQDFNLKSVTLELNGENVIERSYTLLENKQFRLGSAHRLYMTILPEGQHILSTRVTYMIGDTHKNSQIKRVINKTFNRNTVEFKMSSSGKNINIQFQEWN